MVYVRTRPHGWNIGRKHDTEKGDGLQVRDGDMPLLSAFPKWMRGTNTNGKTRTCVLAISVGAMQTLHAIQTCCIAISCSSFSAILDFPTLPRAHDMALLNELGCMCKCTDFRESVTYGGATQTSITVVSKFPRNTWGAMHVQTVDTRHFQKLKHNSIICIPSGMPVTGDY